MTNNVTTNADANTNNMNKNNYQSIDPEHQAFHSPDEIQQEERNRINDYVKLGASIALVLLLCISFSNWNRTIDAVASDTSSAAVLELHKAKQEIALSPQRSSSSPSHQHGAALESSLDAHLERMDEWKREVSMAWGPFWHTSKVHWEGFKQTFGDDEDEVEEKTKAWWSQFSEASKQDHWWNRFAHKSHDWWNQTASKSGGWWDGEKLRSGELWNHTGEWVEDEEHKTGEVWKHTEGWVEDKANKTGGWWNHTKAWVEDKEHKTDGWWNQSKVWVEDEDHQTALWWNKTKHGTTDWFNEEEHNVSHWFNTTEHKATGWFQDEDHRTAVWWNKTENRTTDWFDEEKHDVMHWFNSTENKTTGWFHHAGDWINHEVNDSENWWNESEHKAEGWWYNATHHHKDKVEYVIYMNTTAAYRMLTAGGVGSIDFAQDYFLIQQGYDAQINQAYCPVATSTAIINSLRGSVELPIDPIYDPHPYATQMSLFNDCTNAHVIHKNATYDGIFASPGGLGMPQTEALLKCHLDPTEWNITAHHLDPTLITIESFRQDIQQALAKPHDRVMINYYRKTVNQQGGGHWSPIGAFSPDMDAFLVMDVAKYKYPNAWISTSLLYKSLQTFDTCGMWDFPHGQEALTPEYLRPESSFDMMNAMAILGCESTRRGYITIHKIVDDDENEADASHEPQNDVGGDGHESDLTVNDEPQNDNDNTEAEDESNVSDESHNEGDNAVNEDAGGSDQLQNDADDDDSDPGVSD